MIYFLLLILLFLIFLISFVHYCYTTTNVHEKLEIESAHVLITGGSKGIGKAVAMELIRCGASVTIVARDENTLKKSHMELSNCRSNSTQIIDYKTLDVTWNMEVIKKTINDIIEKSGPINILVNCAGYAIARKFNNTKLTEFEDIINCNLLGTIKVTQVVLVGMKDRKAGQIVLISSVCGQFGFYGYSAYSATKFALKGVSDCLSMEVYKFPYLKLIRDNIGVTVVYPPDTNTEGFLNENKDKPLVTEQISSSGGLMDPIAVAQQIVIAIKVILF
uniref:3-dehydrosphinganine reductase n=1 Tax=Henneguya salminicola TaxID=69463 RepID=A0A6G3MHG2_HENSL